MKTSVTASLQRALAAANRGAVAESLDGLLVAWRACPATALAEAITSLGELIDATEPPISGKTARERSAAWSDRSRSQQWQSLGRLIETVHDTKGALATLARLEALAAWPANPRWSACVLALLERPPFNPGGNPPLWKFLFAELSRLGDPRVLEWTRLVGKAWSAPDSRLSEFQSGLLEGRLRRALPAIERAYASQTRSLTINEAALLSEVLGKVTTAERPAVASRATSKRTERELLQEVYEHPEDDAPRLVYADWLQERGDPRGEHIALQFRRRNGKLTREQARRESDLLAEHGRRWLGAIEPKILRTGMVFERGFLGACRTSSLDERWEWNTVRALDGVVPNRDGLHLASLRVISSAEAFPIGQAARTLALLREPLAVEELRWDGPWIFSRQRNAPAEKVADRETTYAWRSLVALPALRRMTLSGNDLWCQSTVTAAMHSWIWESPWMRHLEELTLPAPAKQLDAWRRIGDAHGLHRLELVTSVYRTRGLSLLLERGDGDRLTHLRIEGAPMVPTPNVVGAEMKDEATQVADALAAVAALPAGALTTLGVTPAKHWRLTARDRAAIEAAVAKQKLIKLTIKG